MKKEPDQVLDDALAASRAQAARRRDVYGEIGPAAMTRLALTFNCLDGMPGIDPWDADKVLKWATAGVHSHGEVLAAKFLLGVWNPSVDWADVARQKGFLAKDETFSRFDLLEAMNVFDQTNIDAVRQWMELPFFP